MVPKRNSSVISQCRLCRFRTSDRPRPGPARPESPRSACVAGTRVDCTANTPTTRRKKLLGDTLSTTTPAHVFIVSRISRSLVRYRRSLYRRSPSCNFCHHCHSLQPSTSSTKRFNMSVSTRMRIGLRSVARLSERPLPAALDVRDRLTFTPSTPFPSPCDRSARSSLPSITSWVEFQGINSRTYRPDYFDVVIVHNCRPTVPFFRKRTLSGQGI